MSEELLMAIGEIDDDLICDARQVPRRTLGFRRMVTILVAATMLLALAGTVAALPYSAVDWFTGFFQGRSGGGLTQEQQDIIEENVESLDQTDTGFGCTVTVESAICDGRTALIRLKVTAPEGTDLTGQNYSFKHWSLSAQECEGGSTSSMETLEDADGLPNTVEMLLTYCLLDGVSFGDSQSWRLKLTTLVSRDSRTETWEDNERLVCAGIWRFDLQFEQKDSARELISEPLEAWGVYDMEGELDVAVIVTSLSLDSLSVDLQYEYPDPERTLGALNMYGVRVVMRDGTEVLARFDSAHYRTSDNVGEIRFELATPIDPEQVDYVLLHNGVKVPAE